MLRDSNSSAGYSGTYSYCRTSWLWFWSNSLCCSLTPAIHLQLLPQLYISSSYPSYTPPAVWPVEDLHVCVWHQNVCMPGFSSLFLLCSFGFQTVCIVYVTAHHTITLCLFGLTTGWCIVRVMYCDNQTSQYWEFGGKLVANTNVQWSSQLVGLVSAECSRSG